MAENTAAAQAPQNGPDVNRWILTPHRSLSPKGLLIVMGILGTASLATGIGFLLAGAWPVLGFFGLDVLIVYLAFRFNYRAGRLYETVEITCAALDLRRVHPSGREERFSFNPLWVRVILAEGGDGRTTLRLCAHGREVGFAGFLTDAERRDFAGALASALGAATGGPRI